MLLLPPIFDKTVLRPEQNDFEPPYHIPHPTQKDFWFSFYQQLQLCYFHSPVPKDIPTVIDQDIGYYGLRSHPVNPSQPYFHIGIEMKFTTQHEVQPIASGVLEHSGYGAINGYYVLLSHPEVRTEDGYVLHSMYCHLKKPLVRFNSYQKMLREISLGSYPIIDIDTKQVLGMTGNSGVVSGNHQRLYLQLDFRKFDETTIALDPYTIFTGTEGKNQSIQKLG